MNLNEYKKKKMADPDFAKAYGEVSSELETIRTIIDNGVSKNANINFEIKKETRKPHQDVR